jgi:hypothetical protein
MGDLFGMEQARQWIGTHVVDAAPEPDKWLAGGDFSGPLFEAKRNVFACFDAYQKVMRFAKNGQKDAPVTVTREGVQAKAYWRWSIRSLARYARRQIKFSGSKPISP